MPSVLLVGKLGTRPLRGAQRFVVRALATTFLTGTVAVGVLAVSAPGARAQDDYPWAGQGRCPIVPQEPVVEPTPTGGAEPGGPEAPATPAVPPPPPPLVHDPVSGHLYDPRGPRPTCARRVWSIDGSIGDSWGFVLRNCTSFVAWRLQERNRMAGFGNRYGGRHWGDAQHWDDAARALGLRVDGVPAIGAVAQTDAGRVGHVAWVTAIGPGTVTVEEYNHLVPGGYSVRTVPTGDFRYLHLDDLAPSPLLGSDRPSVSVPDGLGESWTARVDDGGTLRLSRPGRPSRVVGQRGTFSPVVAPALTRDRGGRPWLAATTRDGRVLVGAVRGSGVTLRTVATAAPTSSPALSLDRTGRPVVAATSAAGTLVTRRWTPQQRWSHATRVGRAGSWATHVAPVLGQDASGRTWLVAVGATGRTWTRPLGSGRLAPLPGPPSSLTSTPALSLSADGTARLHQVGASGRLTVRTLAGRRWGRARVLAGDWSPYSSPTVAEVAEGDLVVAAVERDGGLLVRPAVPGRATSFAARVRTAGDPTRSPGLVTRRNAGVYVVAPDGRGARLLIRPASAVIGDTAPTSAGFGA